MDGWAVSPLLKQELSGLDLSKWEGAAPPVTLLLQVGARADLTPPHQALAAKLGAQAATVVMPPFWNLLDYAPAGALIKVLKAKLEDAGD
jgi:hypothetical protein